MPISLVFISIFASIIISKIFEINQRNELLNIKVIKMLIEICHIV